MTTTLLSSYNLPRFGCEDEQQRIHLNALLDNIHGLLTGGIAPTGAAGGDLTGSYPNPTVGLNKITNAKLDQMPANSLKGNNTGGVANVANLSIGQVNTLLGTITSGSAAGGDLGNVYPNPSVLQVNGIPAAVPLIADGVIYVLDTITGWNGVSVSGDITLSKTGAATVAKINGATLGSTTPTSGNILIGNISNSAWVSRTVTGDATLSQSGALTLKSSVALAGAPTTTTATVKDNSTNIATTAFVNSEINAIGQYFAPATGATVSPTAPQMFQNVFINPAAGIATLTLTLPTGTLQGQVMWVAFTQAVTTLTVTATNIGTHGIASPTAATATSSFAWAWDNTAARWNRFA